MGDSDVAEIERLVEQRRRAIAMLKKLASLHADFGDTLLIRSSLVHEVRGLLQEIDDR